jgi:hypothetical protein
VTIEKCENEIPTANTNEYKFMVEMTDLLLNTKQTKI